MAGLTELSVAELVEHALQSSFDAEDEVGNQESIKSWEAIGELHKRADLETLGTGKHLLQFDLAWHRARGAAILGQLRYEAGSLSKERFEALATALLVEKDMRA